MEDKEMDLQLKLMELELQKIATLTTHPEPSPTTVPSFDISRQVQLCHDLQKKKWTKFFSNYEKVAANLHWPSKSHTMLLQNVFIGKACVVYSAFSVE